VTGFKPKQPIDIVLMAHHHYRVSDFASVFAYHIRALHEKIRDKIMKNNVDYKASAHYIVDYHTFIYMPMHPKVLKHVSNYILTHYDYMYANNRSS